MSWPRVAGTWGTGQAGGGRGQCTRGLQAAAAGWLAHACAYMCALLHGPVSVGPQASHYRPSSHCAALLHGLHACGMRHADMHLAHSRQGRACGHRSLAHICPLQLALTLPEMRSAMRITSLPGSVSLGSRPTQQASLQVQAGRACSLASCATSWSPAALERAYSEAGRPAGAW